MLFFRSSRSDAKSVIAIEKTCLNRDKMRIIAAFIFEKNKNLFYLNESIFIFVLFIHVIIKISTIAINQSTLLHNNR